MIGSRASDRRWSFIVGNFEECGDNGKGKGGEPADSAAQLRKAAMRCNKVGCE